MTRRVRAKLAIVSAVSFLYLIATGGGNMAEGALPNDVSISTANFPDCTPAEFCHYRTPTAPWLVADARDPSVRIQIKIVGDQITSFVVFNVTLAVYNANNKHIGNLTFESDKMPPDGVIWLNPAPRGAPPRESFEFKPESGFPGSLPSGKLLLGFKGDFQVAGYKVPFSEQP